MKKKLQHFLKGIFIDQEYKSSNSRDLSGQVAIVTGNTGVIGSAITKVLEDSGAVVVGASVDGENKIDVTNETQVANLIQKTIKNYGKVDILVNNAGVFSYGAVENIKADDFDKTYNINVKGTFLMTKHVVPIMKSKGHGTIINIGSKISKNTRVEPNKSLYALTKYAVDGFSFALNRELKPFGIRVTCLMPGTVNTFFSKKYKNYMSSFDVAEIIAFIAKNPQIDFESITFKSLRQDI